MSRTWADGPLFGFDTETTGVDPTEARIVTTTAVVVRNGTAKPREWLADPGIEIPDGAAAIHGITTEHARTYGRPARDVVGEVAIALYDAWSAGLAVIAYNASYDLTVLDCEMQRHYGDRLQIKGPVIDPFVIDKHVDRYRRGSRKLADTCRHYGVRMGEQGAHNATADTIGTVRLAWRLAHEYPQIGDTPLDELHRLQSEWYREQAGSLQAYFMRKGRTDDAAGVSTDWPIRTPQTAVDPGRELTPQAPSRVGGLQQETTP